MCFYYQYQFACEDWRWGNFRRHCEKEYRMGETCGTKLIWNTIPLQGKCTLCRQLDIKQRRRAKAVSDYGRWRLEWNRRMSAAKAWDTINALSAEILKLEARRERERSGIGRTGKPRKNPAKHSGHAYMQSKRMSEPCWCGQSSCSSVTRM